MPLLNRARGLAALVLATVFMACADEGTDDVAGQQAEAVTDNVDPARAKEDRIAESVTLFGRRISLHISDADNSGWATIEDGDPGDEAWLDRSFNLGATWHGRIGKTDIPKGGRSWRTKMFAVDDDRRGQLGALRACGKAGNRREIACTSWFRSKVKAGTPAEAAATTMMKLYDSNRKLWNTGGPTRIGWWNSANVLTALIDFEERTGTKTWHSVIEEVFNSNKGNDFTNDLMDDTAWWGLAWIRAYDVTRDGRYLDMARRDADHLWKHKDDTCGGGVWWRDDRKYKNAITNELFIKLAASLHNRMPGDQTYLARAKEIWEWFDASGMINGQNLINDGLGSDCRNNGDMVWTYNQGVILGGLVELNKATGDASLLARATQLADASTRDPHLSPDGVLREPCELFGGEGCGRDGGSFKGSYVRNLAELNRHLNGRPYTTYLKRQADTMMAKNRTSLDQYGVKWAGPFEKFDGATQHSALDALNAALP
ncbi:MAG TPA: glycoside hydrolase family 76 protein [Labilithrix sp.]|nr:glycoside hydrolase family 76 protein [Labilithrix sp.]